MLQNLFQASQQQILRALDRGLDDFMTTTSHSRSNRRNVAPPNRGYDTTLTPQENAQMVAAREHDNETRPEQQPSSDHRSSNIIMHNKSRIIDANIVQRNGVNVSGTDRDVTAPPNDTLQRQQTAALASMQYNTTTSSTATTGTISSKTEEAAASAATGLDFAVRAAKMAYAKRNQVPSPGTTQDYAVQQAAKIQAARQSVSQQKASIRHRHEVDPVPRKSATTIPPPPRSPMLNENAAVSRSFMTTISTPSEYYNANSRKRTDASTTKAMPTLEFSNPVDSHVSNKDANATEMKPVSNDMYDRQTPPAPIQNKAINLNVRVNEKEPFETPTFETSSSNNNGKDDIYNLTQMAFDEMIELNSDDMTPEEMLAQVMKYGTEQEMNERDGTGFVSAAFDKAKALLREQNERRDARLRQERPAESRVGEMATTDPFASTETLSPSEELRKMFMAGESIAESRITTTTTRSGSMGSARTTTDQDIDALIESEKTVTRHARVLDEELTELMVRINKSPTEGSDGVGRHQFFDVLSGPEVYDQNVDPLSAVNWPGALPGTKKLRLPKELDEAVRQANFAAGVLTNVEEVESKDGVKSYRIGKRELSGQQLTNLQGVVKEAVEIGLIDDPLILQQEEARLQMLLDELAYQPEERMREIASNYKDLLLSENFIDLVKKRLNEMSERDLDALRRDDDSLDSIHTRERELLGQLVVYAQLLLKEVQALGAELESQQLEVIRSICKVAMDPAHRTEEETAMALSDAVRDMRPLFDDGFIAYLKYAVAEEEGKLARAGLLHDPEYNQWLFVLKIVQQGVHAEIAKGINRYLEHIWYVLRMDTPAERRMLLEKLIDVMPTLDVRPFVQVVENIVGSLGDAVRGEFDGATVLGEMTNKLLQLHRDLKEVLPADRIARMSRDADEWAAKQKQRLLEQRNLTKQRLKAAQDTEHLDGEIEEFGKRGEVERFD